MAKKNKPSRKELLKEPDEFLTFSRRLFQWSVSHWKPMALALAVVLILGAGYSGLQCMNGRAEQQAYALLNRARSQYDTAKAEKGDQEAYRAVASEFNTLLGSYADTDAGRFARALYANMAYRAGDMEKAVSLYKEGLKDFEAHPAVRGLILDSLGYAYAGKKDYSAAIDCYQRLADGGDVVFKVDALFNLGLLYQETGKAEQSRNAFQKLAGDSTDSIYQELVRDKLKG